MLHYESSIISMSLYCRVTIYIGVLMCNLHFTDKFIRLNFMVLFFKLNIMPFNLNILIIILILFFRYYT